MPQPPCGANWCAGRLAMSEPDKAALAVAHVFEVGDSEWTDRLVELLRDADMEAFRVKLLAEHERRLARWRRGVIGEDDD